MTTSGTRAWLSSLGHHTLLAALAVPEQEELATSLRWAKPETQASGERVCEYTLGGGGAAGLPGQGGV